MPRSSKLEKSAQDKITLLVLEEEAEVRKRVRPTGKVRVSKKVNIDQKSVPITVVNENIEIKRVKIDRVIDKPVKIREQKNEIIVPVMEEVEVVSKQLVLREEIHLIKRVNRHEKIEQIELKNETVEVERLTEK